MGTGDVMSWRGYDDCDYEEYERCEEARWEEADRAYDEMKDELVMVSSKQEAIEFAERYPVMAGKVAHWLKEE